jgi:hypothetical protein
MKCLIPLLILFLFSCNPPENTNFFRQADSSRMADSLKIVDSVTQTTKTAMEKASADSMNSLAACPGLKNYMIMSHHIAALTNSGEGAEVVRKKFKQLSDSLIVMETEILSNTYKDLPPSCQELFLERMKKNADEISSGFNKKLKGE